MRPHGTPDQLEQRRRQALSLLREGHTFRDVAQKMKASLSSVVRWCQTYRKHGRKGLKSRKRWGRPSFLSDTQKKDLQRRLLKGPLVAGYATDLWTLKRIAEVVRKRYGRRYTEVGVWKILRQDLGWCCQKPERRALERDEKAIEQWKTHRRGAHLGFLDESGFLLIPNVRKTWGPRGRTPILLHRYRRDKISVIG